MYLKTLLWFEDKFCDLLLLLEAYIDSFYKETRNK